MALAKNARALDFIGGEGGIRTHETVTRLLDFESSSFDRTRTPLHVVGTYLLYRFGSCLVKVWAGIFLEPS